MGNHLSTYTTTTREGTSYERFPIMLHNSFLDLSKFPNSDSEKASTLEECEEDEPAGPIGLQEDMLVAIAFLRELPYDIMGNGSSDNQYNPQWQDSEDDIRLNAGTGTENAVSVETETKTETTSYSSTTDYTTDCNCAGLSHATSTSTSTSTSNTLVPEAEFQALALRETLAENENERFDVAEELRVVKEKAVALEEEKRASDASLEWVKGILAKTVLKLDSTGKTMGMRTTLGVQEREGGSQTILDAGIYDDDDDIQPLLLPATDQTTSAVLDLIRASSSSRPISNSTSIISPSQPNANDGQNVLPLSLNARSQILLISSLEREVDEKDKKILEQQDSNAATLQRLQSLQDQLQSLDSESQRQKNVIEEQYSEIVGLKEKLANKEEEAVKQTRLVEKEKKCVLQLDQKSRSRLLRLNAAQMRVRTLEEDVEKQVQAVVEVEKKAEVLTQTVEKERETVKALERDNEKKRLEVEALEEKLREKDQEKVDLGDKLSWLEKEAREKDDVICKIQHARDEYESEKNTHRKAVQALKEALAKKDKELGRRIQLWDEERWRADELDKRLTVRLSQLDELEVKLVKEEERAKTLEEAGTKMKVEMEMLRGSLSLVEAKREVLKRDFDTRIKILDGQLAVEIKEKDKLREREQKLSHESALADTKHTEQLQEKEREKLDLVKKLENLKQEFGKTYDIMEEQRKGQANSLQSLHKAHEFEASQQRKVICDQIAKIDGLKQELASVKKKFSEKRVKVLTQNPEEQEEQKEERGKKSDVDVTTEWLKERLRLEETTKRDRENELKRLRTTLIVEMREKETLREEKRKVDKSLENTLDVVDEFLLKLEDARKETAQYRAKFEEMEERCKTLKGTLDD